jgi:phosphate transport system substrate-binding protein
MPALSSGGAIATGSNRALARGARAVRGDGGRRSRLEVALALLLVGLAVAAATSCERGSVALGPGGGAAPTPAVRRTLRGGGASFPQPMFLRWAQRHFGVSDLRLEYRVYGSMAGIEALERGDLDFGASELPFDPAELDRRDLVQFPVLVGAVVPVANLPEIRGERLVLDADLLAGIYLGSVRRWNDRRIVALNPRLRLPDRDIVPVHRVGRSGTTQIFAEYLQQKSAAWGAAFGGRFPADWPAGVGADDNEQMARFVKRFRYTIGYVELSRAAELGLAIVSLRTAPGATVAPTVPAIAAAADGARFVAPTDLRLELPNRWAAKSWPLVGVSYAVVKRRPSNAKRSARTLAFFDWSLTAGRAVVRESSFVALPEHLVPPIEAEWRLRGLKAAERP